MLHPVHQNLYQVCKSTAGDNDGTVYSGTSRIGRGPKHGPRTGEVLDHINRVDPTASKTIDADDRSPSAHEFLHGILHETRNEKVPTGISDTTGTLPTRLGLLRPFNPLNLLIAKLTLKYSMATAATATEDVVTAPASWDEFYQRNKSDGGDIEELFNGNITRWFLVTFKKKLS